MNLFPEKISYEALEKKLSETQAKLKVANEYVQELSKDPMAVRLLELFEDRRMLQFKFDTFYQLVFYVKQGNLHQNNLECTCRHCHMNRKIIPYLEENKNFVSPHANFNFNIDKVPSG